MYWVSWVSWGAPFFGVAALCHPIGKEPPRCAELGCQGGWSLHHLSTRSLFWLGSLRLTAQGTSQTATLVLFFVSTMSAESTCPCRGTLDLDVELQTPSGSRKMTGSLNLSGSLALGSDFDRVCNAGNQMPITLVLMVDAVRVVPQDCLSSSRAAAASPSTGEAVPPGDAHREVLLAAGRGDQDMTCNHGHDSARCLDEGLGDGFSVAPEPPTLPVPDAVAQLHAQDSPPVVITVEDSIPPQEEPPLVHDKSTQSNKDHNAEQFDTQSKLEISDPPPKKRRTWALRPECRSGSSMPSDSPTAPRDEEEVNPFGGQVLQGVTTVFREMDLSFG